MKDLEYTLINNIYIFELNYFRDYYINIYKEFRAKIDNLCLPYTEKINELNLKHQNEKDYCVLQEHDFQEYFNYMDLKYHCLSGILQNLVSLWENQMNDFYLCYKCKGVSELNTQFNQDNYFNLDNNTELYEIRQVANYLKHGEFGNAQKNLKNMKSRFYLDNNLNGEIRGNIFRNKQLVIQLDDIEYFANKLIDFWKKVASNL